MREYKYCPACGELKSVSTFSRNRARLDGLETCCKICRSLRRKKKYQEFQMRKAKRYLTPHMMGDELFEVFYGNPELHKYINQYAQRKSRRSEIQELFKAEAWIRIAMTPTGKSVEGLKDVAKKAIDAAYRKRLYRYKYAVTNDLELMSREEYMMWRTGICWM